MLAGLVHDCVAEHSITSAVILGNAIITIAQWGGIRSQALHEAP
jgi:hypothetical protein